MLSVRLSDDLEKRLQALSEETKRSKSYYVEEALLQYLEDREDYLIALARLEAKGPRVSLAEAKKQLGFLDE